MLFISLIQWWYSDGWKRQARRISTRLEGTIDYFSISLLLKTLFQPFRQISAGKIEGSLDVQLRALGDKLLSRLIGGMIRLVIIGVGMVAITIHACLGMVMLIVWAFVPFLPVFGIVAAVMGWGF